MLSNQILHKQCIGSLHTILPVLALTRGQLLCLYVCPTCLELWPEAFKAMYPSGTPIKVAAFSSILFNFDS
jgi:hypothetical protein